MAYFGLNRRRDGESGSLLGDIADNMLGVGEDLARAAGALGDLGGGLARTLQSGLASAARGLGWESGGNFLKGYGYRSDQALHEYLITPAAPLTNAELEVQNPMDISKNSVMAAAIAEEQKRLALRQKAIKNGDLALDLRDITKTRNESGDRVFQNTKEILSAKKISDPSGGPDYVLTKYGYYERTVNVQIHGQAVVERLSVTKDGYTKHTMYSADNKLQYVNETLDADMKSQNSRNKDGKNILQQEIQRSRENLEYKEKFLKNFTIDKDGDRITRIYTDVDDVHFEMNIDLGTNSWQQNNMKFLDPALIGNTVRAAKAVGINGLNMNSGFRGKNDSHNGRAWDIGSIHTNVPDDPHKKWEYNTRNDYSRTRDSGTKLWTPTEYETRALKNFATELRGYVDSGAVWEPWYLSYGNSNPTRNMIDNEALKDFTYEELTRKNEHNEPIHGRAIYDNANHSHHLHYGLYNR